MWIERIVSNLISIYPSLLDPFENAGFTLEAQQMFSVHTAPEKRELSDCRDFEKLPF